jgi:hypothetical protein
MKTYSDNLILQFDDDITGNAAAGALVTVFDAGLATKPSIFDVLGAPIANPLTTDAKGNYAFQVADGIYDVVGKAGTPDETRRDRVEIIEQITANVLINNLSQAYEFDTIGLMMSSVIIFPLNKTVSTKGHTASYDGGGATWFTSGVTGTPSTVNLAIGTVFNANGDGFEYAFNNAIALKEVNPMAFGSVANGVVNNSGIVNALLSFADAVFLPSNALGFAMTNIAVPIGKKVYGIGHESRVKALTSSNTPLFSLSSFASVSNIFMFASGGRNSGLTLQNAIEIPFAQVQTSVDNVWFDGFGGSAYLGIEAVNNHEGNSITNSKIRECNIGINASERFEYLNMTGNIIYLCNTGLRSVGGNLLATGTTISDNLIGVHILTGDNAGHGQISGALINHNINNAIIVDGITQGYDLTACEIWNNGPILLKNCNGISFIGGTKSETSVLEENCFDCRFDSTRLRGGVDNTPNFNATSSEVFYHDCPMELITSGLSINSLNGGRLRVANNTSQTAIPVGDTTFVFDTITSNSITANATYTKQNFYASNVFSGATARVRGGATLEFVMQLNIGRTDTVTFDVDDIVVSLINTTDGSARVGNLISMDKTTQTATNYARYLFNGPVPRGDIIVNIENNTGAVLTVYGDIPSSLVLSRAEVTGW